MFGRSQGISSVAFAFDTLSSAKRLRDAGIASVQAEAHAEAAREFVMAELVIKTDLETAIAGVRHDLDAGLGSLRRDLESGLASVRRDFGAALDNMELR